MKVVETNNLEKTYQLNNLAVHALRGISLSFTPGEFAAVAGPSGSGKTTFLHLVGCLDVPTAGTVSVSGNDTAVMTKKELAVLRRKTTGFIFQAYNLIPVLTAFENVSMPLVLLGIPSGEVRERSEQLCDVGLAGMETADRKRCRGQQQRVVSRGPGQKPAIVPPTNRRQILIP